MSPDRRRQASTIAAFTITLLLNGAANVLPLNGRTTASISDSLPALVNPAGYVFAIWGLIYALQLAFTVQQARPSKATDPLLRRLGYLPAAVGLLNAAWIVLWHWGVFVLTVPVMIAILLALIEIDRRIRHAWPAALISGSDTPGQVRWLVRLPFSVYLGWISVATIANVAAFLLSIGYRGAPFPEEAWAVAVLGVGLAIAGWFVLTRRDPAYGLVFVWAYAGIVVKQAASPAVATFAGFGTLVVLILVIVVLVSGRSGRLDRKAEPGRGPAAGRAVQADRAAVRLDQVPGDGQAEP